MTLQTEAVQETLIPQTVLEESEPNEQIVMQVGLFVQFRKGDRNEFPSSLMIPVWQRSEPMCDLDH